MFPVLLLILSSYYTSFRFLRDYRGFAAGYSSIV